MDEVDRRHLGEPQQGLEGHGVVVAVDDLGRHGDGREVVDDGDGRSADLGRHLAEIGAVDDRLVAAPEQTDGDVTDVDLRAGAGGQRDVGQEYAQLARTPTACSSAAANGRKWSRSRRTTG